MRLRQHLVIAALPLMVACQYDPYTAVFTSTRPEPSALVGTYTPTARTMAMIKRTGYPPAESQIVLRADGTFLLERVPDWWLTDFGKPAGGFDSGSGKWSVTRSQEWWAIELDFNSIQLHSKPDLHGLVTYAMLVGQAPPYLLHLTIGDPDVGKAMQFSLQSSTE